MLIKEFCAENMELVPAAVAAGAARIELCDNLAVGGTTPSYGVIRAAVAFAREKNVDVMCMIRPRGGSFEHTPAEAAMMRDDLIMAKRLGVTGVVFGCLRGGRLDTELLQTFAQPQEEPSRRRYRFWVEFTPEDVAWFKAAAAERGFRFGSIK